MRSLFWGKKALADAEEDDSEGKLEDTPAGDQHEDEPAEQGGLAFFLFLFLFFCSFFFSFSLFFGRRTKHILEKMAEKGSGKVDSPSFLHPLKHTRRLTRNQQ